MAARPKPPRAGRRVRSLAALYEASMERRSVVGAMTHGRPSPAAWVISQQGRTIHYMLTRGLWLYVPNRAKKERPAWVEANERLLEERARKSAAAHAEDIPF